MENGEKVQKSDNYVEYYEPHNKPNNGELKENFQIEGRRVN